ncbi:hypothetical protein HZ326_9987 [Fusarium oxysporum f. sp. albedinis]|nr:hypothetical protein HZ326_9987 [Fusarium oxysporum f. sp. albedinis]
MFEEVMLPFRLVQCDNLAPTIIRKWDISLIRSLLRLRDAHLRSLPEAWMEIRNRYHIKLALLADLRNRTGQFTKSMTGIQADRRLLMKSVQKIESMHQLMSAYISQPSIPLLLYSDHSLS